MVATALAAAGSVLWMQGRYEASDQRHALEIVQSYQPPGGTDLPALIARRHPDKLVEWSSAVENSCYQHIRVHAVVAEPEPVLYAFVVDINGPSIHPANDEGKDLLSHLGKPLPALPASASSGAAVASASVAPRPSSAPSSVSPASATASSSASASPTQ